MSLTTVPMYRVVCDQPGCQASPQDDCDYYAWKDPDAGPYEDADSAGWQVTDAGDFCPDHERETET